MRFEPVKPRDIGRLRKSRMNIKYGNYKRVSKSKTNRKNKDKLRNWDIETKNIELELIRFLKNWGYKQLNNTEFKMSDRKKNPNHNNHEINLKKIEAWNLCKSFQKNILKKKTEHWLIIIFVEFSHYSSDLTWYSKKIISSNDELFIWLPYYRMNLDIFRQLQVEI